MSRYIDADAFEKYLNREEWETPDEKWWPEREIGMILDVIPTADVVEVVRGEWIQHDEGVYQEKEKNWWRCSNCGNVIYSEHEDDRKEFHKWCGRCGAYMRGENDAEIH